MTKKYKPTDENRKLVEQMSAVGIPQDGIAAVLEIDRKTLAKHFHTELDTAATKANAKIGGTLFNKAMNGDTTAMIWWTKARMRWSETSVQEIHRKDISDKPLTGEQRKAAGDEWLKGTPGDQTPAHKLN
jgi:hypothetical protein